MYIGISQQDLDIAKETYNSMAMDPSEGKIPLIRKTLFKIAWGYYVREYAPIKMTLSEVLSSMISSGIYYLDSSFLSGVQLDEDR